MWIFLNDAMFSAVEDKNDPTQLVVRARISGDLEKVFPKHRVITTTDSDYRFRIFINRDLFSSQF